MFKLLVCCFAFLSLNLIANDIRPKGATPSQERWMSHHNKELGKTGPSAPINVKIRPFAEYEQAGYLLFSSTTNFGSDHIKDTLAKELPDEMQLVITTRWSGEKQSLINHYGQFIDPNRIHIVTTSGSAFWARDAFPLPVLSEDDNLRLVDARYYHGLEPDNDIAKAFKAPLSSHSYYYEGGNFLSDTMGNCMVVNKTATASIPIAAFGRYYGCKTLTRMPHVSGIGHIDEKVKFISDTVAVTDYSGYQPTLEAVGKKVHLLPRAGNEIETYVNSLLMGNKIFVPIYGHANDEQALQVYRSLGLEVFPLDSKMLSNIGKGSIHCITMTYPPVSLESLLNNLGLEKL